MKKYRSIAEVSNITSLTISKLRYIEKSDPVFKVIKIRDRRYYTQENIEYLKEHYAQCKDDEDTCKIPISVQIDQLIENFQNLLNTAIKQ